MDIGLAVISGPFAGQTIPLTQGKLVVGRDSDCDVILGGDFVSSHHCALLLDEWTLRVIDLGSKNGTYVNGDRIGSGAVILNVGDTVSAGLMSIRVESSEAGLDSQNLTDDATSIDENAPKKEDANPA